MLLIQSSLHKELREFSKTTGMTKRSLVPKDEEAHEF
jgi:hypothetical protein